MIAEAIAACSCCGKTANDKIVIPGKKQGTTDKRDRHFTPVTFLEQGCICEVCEAGMTRKNFGPVLQPVWTEDQARKAGYLARKIPPLPPPFKRKWTDATCLKRYPTEVLITYPNGKTKLKGGAKRKRKVTKRKATTNAELKVYFTYVETMQSHGITPRSVEEWISMYRAKT